MEEQQQRQHLITCSPVPNTSTDFTHNVRPTTLLCDAGNGIQEITILPFHFKTQLLPPSRSCQQSLNVFPCTLEVLHVTARTSMLHIFKAIRLSCRLLWHHYEGDFVATTLCIHWHYDGNPMHIPVIMLPPLAPLLGRKRLGQVQLEIQQHWSAFAMLCCACRVLMLLLMLVVVMTRATMTTAIMMIARVLVMNIPCLLACNLQYRHTAVCHPQPQLLPPFGFVSGCTM